MGELKPGWRRVKFGEVVRLVTDRCDPVNSGIERFVGLEHIEPGDLRVRSSGRSLGGNHLHQPLPTGPGALRQAAGLPTQGRSRGLRWRVFRRHLCAGERGSGTPPTRIAALHLPDRCVLRARCGHFSRLAVSEDQLDEPRGVRVRAASAGGAGALGECTPIFPSSIQCCGSSDTCGGTGTTRNAFSLVSPRTGSERRFPQTLEAHYRRWSRENSGRYQKTSGQFGWYEYATLPESCQRIGWVYRLVRYNGDQCALGRSRSMRIAGWRYPDQQGQFYELGRAWGHLPENTRQALLLSRSLDAIPCRG